MRKCWLSAFLPFSTMFVSKTCILISSTLNLSIENAFYLVTNLKSCHPVKYGIYRLLSPLNINFWKRLTEDGLRILLSITEISKLEFWYEYKLTLIWQNDKFSIDSIFLRCSFFSPSENIVCKGEIAYYKQIFLCLSQAISPFLTIFSTQMGALFHFKCTLKCRLQFVSIWTFS